jgi:hypothetical protein
MDLHYLGGAGSGSHQSEKSDPKALQPAGRCGAHNRAMEAHLGAAVTNNGTKEAHNGVLEGL